MPTYEFECQQCGHRFNLVESIKAHDKHKEVCPKCKTTQVRSLISAVNVRTSKKS